MSLTTFRTGQHDPGSQSQRLRRFRRIVSDVEFGTLISAQYQGGKLLGRHSRFVAVCLHPWHSDANLLRIYDRELVTRDTSPSSSFNY